MFVRLDEKMELGMKHNVKAAVVIKIMNVKILIKSLQPQWSILTRLYC